MAHLTAVLLAIGIDKLLGDPQWLPHPVRGMGWMISKLDRILNKGSQKVLKGTCTAFIVTLVPFMMAILLTHYSYQFHIVAGIIVEAFLIFTTIAQNSLAKAAMDVYLPLKDGEVETARKKLSWIVGRDTENLDEGEIVRGVVETVAENTSDGITAPIFYAVIGGAPLAIFYRSVNTLDSMLGYKNEKYLLFGRASAKWDDWMNLIPSRLTGLCMILGSLHVSALPIRKAFRVLFRDSRNHPSPNSGWGEAAMAALLGVQLGGMNTYIGLVSNRPKMGVSIRLLQQEHILTSISIMNRTVYLFLILSAIFGGVLYVLSITWGKSFIYF
ncbi:adenosylcobinamide-phosphate synthase CbiB [Bacillus sp. DJP31]|uniref:adenosylcobinamide-phosphate synthase CbiB n=1 Tax=Bacillus sp. DJP31 TaxID=3409789 RepID=UPI003BB8000C